MNNIAQNSTTSKKEIKINMTFGQALEITQQTYNYFNKLKYERELNELCIKRKKIPEKWLDEEIEKLRKKITEIEMIDKKIIKPFVLFNDSYDEKSNFSGLTYIYDDEKTNTVNVAIACRGSVKFSLCTEEGKKDWRHNNWGMLRKPNTDSDNFAKNYAIDILAKIQHQYSDKQINVITLGHSKGGREAQKQMLAIFEKIKKDDKYSNVNIYCLTFNSAACSKEDNKENYDEYHTNLFVYNKWDFGVDPVYITRQLVGIFFSILIIIIVFLCYIFYKLGLIPLLIMLVILFLFNLIVYKTRNYFEISRSIAIIIMLFGSMITILYSLISIACKNHIMPPLNNLEYVLLSIGIGFSIVIFVVISVMRAIKLGINCGKNLDYEVPYADILTSHDLKSFFQGKLFKDVQSCNLNEALEKLANQKDNKKS